MRPVWPYQIERGGGDGFLALFEGKTMASDFIEVSRVTDSTGGVSVNEDYISLSAVGQSYHTSTTIGEDFINHSGFINTLIPKVDLERGLVAYYPFNGNANDESGNGNDGTPYGGVQLTDDRFANENSAYNFDGINDYIVYPGLGEDAGLFGGFALAIEALKRE